MICTKCKGVTKILFPPQSINSENYFLELIDCDYCEGKGKLTVKLFRRKIRRAHKEIAHIESEIVEYSNLIENIRREKNE